MEEELLENIANKISTINKQLKAIKETKSLLRVAGFLPAASRCQELHSKKMDEWLMLLSLLPWDLAPDEKATKLLSSTFVSQSK